MTETCRELVTENMGLVHLCAKKFVGRGEDYEDLFQIGCVGLVKAAEKFDPELGNKFSTYAVAVILGELRSSFREGKLIKVSRSLRSLGADIAETTAALTESLGRAPSLYELSEYMELPVEKIAEAISACRPVNSISAHEEGERPVDIPDRNDDIGDVTERLSLRQSVEKLNEKDRLLIELRYCRAKTQRETAEILGSNQVQISRREKKILLELRGVLL